MERLAREQELAAKEDELLTERQLRDEERARERNLIEKERELREAEAQRWQLEKQHIVEEMARLEALKRQAEIEHEQQLNRLSHHPPADVKHATADEGLEKDEENQLRNQDEEKAQEVMKAFSSVRVLVKYPASW